MKKFSYRLQPVLKAEEFRLSALLSQHQELERFLDQAQEVRRQFLLDIAADERAWARAFQESPGARHLFLGREQTLQSRERLLAVAEERIGELQSLLEQSQESIDAARREVARLEKIRERQWKSYLSDVQRLEQKTLDEQSLQRYGRSGEAF